MTPERALEIIAACGADSRRWPADERDAALLLAIADPAVAAALAKARSLDTLLAGWATAVTPAAPLEAAALIPAAAAPPPLPSRRARWWFGGAVAAALTGLVVFTPSITSLRDPATQVAATDQAHVSPVPSATGESEALAETEVFATVFTPTADEDQLI